MRLRFDNAAKRRPSFADKGDGTGNTLTLESIEKFVVVVPGPPVQERLNLFGRCNVIVCAAKNLKHATISCAIE